MSDASNIEEVKSKIALGEDNDLYFVFSSKPINELHQKLFSILKSYPPTADRLSAGDKNTPKELIKLINVFHRMEDGQWRGTHDTIMVAQDIVWEALRDGEIDYTVENKDNDMHVRRYDSSRGRNRVPPGHTKDWLVRLPPATQLTMKGRYPVGVIEEKMLRLVSWDFIPAGKYKVEGNYSSREGDGKLNMIVVRFDDDVDQTQIEKSRLILINSVWPPQLEGERNMKAYYKIDWGNPPPTKRVSTSRKSTRERSPVRSDKRSTSLAPTPATGKVSLRKGTSKPPQAWTEVQSRRVATDLSRMQPTMVPTPPIEDENKYDALMTLPPDF